ncbi:hypothetical protein BV898_09041 [Hypsibius exemplaris]|uniref:Uncharacterized protein n=1 Tax=Hypsibius exemplaris TaxID=2072580 RepID=A0A1W0WNW3_HYPEX|nr:hypothetical protein BV898_09041 [Hypsibius exemplaris]
MEVLTFAALVTIICFILYLWLYTGRPKNFPPGPPGLPVFGNLLSYGAMLHLSMLKWKEQYGDVFSVYEGSIRYVILNNYNTVRKVFAEELAAGRPTTAVRGSDRATFGGGTGLVFSEGDLWRTHRRFALSTLRDLGMGKSVLLFICRSLCKLIL